MDPRALNDLNARLSRLERDTVRFRLGVITATSPLSVALGGATVDHTSVKALNGPAPLAVDDVVGVLTFGNDLLILGVIGDGT